MPEPGEPPGLRVEGEDDKHAIIHLLIRHGIDYDSKPWPPEYPEVFTVKGEGGVETLLREMQTAIQASANRPIGFVLDADTPLESRWQAVRDHLRNVGLDAPDSPVPEGFIGVSQQWGTSVGVWLMPDNQHPGTLEDFLETLIDEGDSLIEFADTATTDAKQTHGAAFPEQQTIKAQIHAWLAWQKQPGLPFGTAIRAKFFRDDSDVAIAFVSWFKRLYQIA